MVPFGVSEDGASPDEVVYREHRVLWVGLQLHVALELMDAIIWGVVFDLPCQGLAVFPEIVLIVGILHAYDA
jgi:hypothetical protein